MSTRIVSSEFRTPEQIRADKELAEHYERHISQDHRGWLMIDVTELRRKIAAEEGNAAVSRHALDIPFIWDGVAYRLVKAAYETDHAVIDLEPANSSLESEMKRRIENDRFHRLNYYQGFGFICFPEDYIKYRDL